MASKNTSRGKGLGTGGWAGIGVLVVSLGGVVWWSLPKNDAPQALPDPKETSADAGAADAATLPDDVADLHRLHRPITSTCELAVLTDKTQEELEKVASVENVGKLLDARYCGAACEAVKKALEDKDAFDVEITTAEEYILPARDMIDVVGPTLTEAERASAYARPNVVAIKTSGPATTDHIALRTGFAATAAIADAIGGMVYDETLHRIETAARFRSHVPLSAIGKPAFSTDLIVVQLYKQEDGTARMVTLGMERFGSPDLGIKGPSIANASLLSNVLNAAASSIAGGASDVPITVALADVARVAGKKPEDMSRASASAKPVRLDLVHAARETEDLDENEIVNLVPTSGDKPADYDKMIADLYGQAPPEVTTAFDKELEGVAAGARKTLPGAIARFQSGEGTLFVKGAFPVPAESRKDGGPSEEWLWIQASSCNASACAGTLTATPGYATNLTPDRPVRVYLERAADWLLELPDGGAAGGESIKVLEKRPR